MNAGHQGCKETNGTDGWGGKVDRQMDGWMDGWAGDAMQKRRGARLTDPHHLVDLEPDAREGVGSPAAGALDRGAHVGDFGLVAVQRQPRVVIPAPDDGPRALRLAGADVQEAELVPQQAPDVRLERAEAVLLAVPVKSHCGCGCGLRRLVSASYLYSLSLFVSLFVSLFYPTRR